MRIEEIVKCHPEGNQATQIRELVCQLSRDEPKPGFNPLTVTKFNALLDSITQQAFDAGRDYQKRKAV